MDNALEKALDMAGSVTKLAANLTEPKKTDIPKTTTPKDRSNDNSNKATTGSQTVVVSMDSKKKDPKPIERHIHKFPENRPLTSQECELALKEAQMDYELKKSEQDHIIECDKLNWQHQLEKEKKEERRGRVRRIVGGILLALGIGGTGYFIYTDYRDNKLKANKLPETTPVKAEGEVK